MMSVTRAFKEIRVANKVVHSENGEDALIYHQDGNNDKFCVTSMAIQNYLNGKRFLSRGPMQ